MASPYSLTTTKTKFLYSGFTDNGMMTYPKANQGTFRSTNGGKRSIMVLGLNNAIRDYELEHNGVEKYYPGIHFYVRYGPNGD